MSPAETDRTTLRALLPLLIWPATGVLAGFALLVFALLPRLHLGGVQRIIELGRHLEQDPAGHPWLAFVGDSIVHDGIDAGLVREAAPPGWNVENLGLSGCGLNERRVLLPRLLEARPAWIALGLFPLDLCAPGGLKPDKGYAYAYAGFVQAWPPDRTRDDFPGIGAEAWKALHASRIEQWIHFRKAPAEWIDYQLRVTLRSDLRSGHETDWIHPFTRLGSIRGRRLERHLSAVGANLRSCGEQPQEVGPELHARLAREIRAGSARPLFVLFPLHPELEEAAAPLLPPLRDLAAKLAREADGIVVDATGLLVAAEFADALHPNEEGRRKLSLMVGRALPPPDAGA